MTWNVPAEVLTWWGAVAGALADCPPCRGTGVIRQIDVDDLLATADRPETEQPRETVPCPICGGAGAFVRQETT